MFGSFELGSGAGLVGVWGFGVYKTLGVDGMLGVLGTVAVLGVKLLRWKFFGVVGGTGVICVESKLVSLIAESFSL